MAGSTMVSDNPNQFHDVFTEGPLEELFKQCDATTATSLVGSSNHISNQQVIVQFCKLLSYLASHVFFILTR